MKRQIQAARPLTERGNRDSGRCAWGEVSTCGRCRPCSKLPELTWCGARSNMIVDCFARVGQWSASHTTPIES